MNNVRSLCGIWGNRGYNTSIRCANTVFAKNFNEKIARDRRYDYKAHRSLESFR